MVLGIIGWDVFDEEICEVLASLSTFCLLLVDQSLDLLAHLHTAVQLVDCCLGCFLGVILDIAESLGR